MNDTTTTTAAPAIAAAGAASLSPGRRAWRRFRRNRLGFWSLVLFSAMVVLSLFAELLSTDGYHPSDAGYARWAELMWRGIEKRMNRGG